MEKHLVIQWLCLLFTANAINAFIPIQIYHQPQEGRKIANAAVRPLTDRRALQPSRSTTLQYKNTDGKNGDGDDDMRTFMRSFEKRRKNILQKEYEKTMNLKHASCRSAIATVLPEVVRRVDVDYPLVACGSTSDDVYIANLETGKVVATTSGLQYKRQPNKSDGISQSSSTSSPPPKMILDERVQHVTHQLYGAFDGAGTLAVALHHNLLVEARRTGGVYVWRLTDDDDDDTDNKPDASASTTDRPQHLTALGHMPSLQHCLVTYLKIDDEYLWVGTDDGSVEAYNLDGSFLPLTMRTQPDLLWMVDGTVLSVHVRSDLGCAVVTTDTGAVELLSIEDDEDLVNGDRAASDHQLVRHPIGSFVPPYPNKEQWGSEVFCTCATIITSDPVSTDETLKSDTTFANNGKRSFAIACGSNNGGLFLQSVRLDSNNEIDLNKPFEGQSCQELTPKHFATVKCMASPVPGLLVTAGLDGTLKVWDVKDNDAKFLYQFTGYKVWLGSLWTDGVRIVTDGADNTLIMHDFSAAATANNSDFSSNES